MLQLRRAKSARLNPTLNVYSYGELMPNWLNEFLYVLALSKKTQWAIILGCFFFVGIHLLGWYMLENFELHGPAKGVQDVIAQKMARKYDKVALIALLSFWVLAYKCYQKDKKRLW